MSATAKTYQRLYTEGRVDLAGLQRAVSRGLITAAEYEEITGQVYTPTPSDLEDAVNALETLGYTEGGE